MTTSRMHYKWRTMLVLLWLIKNNIQIWLHLNLVILYLKSCFLFQYYQFFDIVNIHDLLIFDFICLTFIFIFGAVSQSYPVLRPIQSVHSFFLSPLGWYICLPHAPAPRPAFMLAQCASPGEGCVVLRGSHRCHWWGACLCCAITTFLERLVE